MRKIASKITSKTMQHNQFREKNKIKGKITHKIRQVIPGNKNDSAKRGLTQF